MDTDDLKPFWDLIDIILKRLAKDLGFELRYKIAGPTLIKRSLEVLILLPHIDPKKQNVQIIVKELASARNNFCIQELDLGTFTFDELKINGNAERKIRASLITLIEEDLRRP